MLSTCEKASIYSSNRWSTEKSPKTPNSTHPLRVFFFFFWGWFWVWFGYLAVAPVDIFYNQQKVGMLLLYQPMHSNKLILCFPRNLLDGMPWMIFESQVVMLFFSPKMFSKSSESTHIASRKWNGSTVGPVCSPSDPPWKIERRWRPRSHGSVFPCFSDDFRDFDLFFSGEFFAVQKPAVKIFQGCMAWGIVATN